MKYTYDNKEQKPKLAYGTTQMQRCNHLQFFLEQTVLLDRVMSKSIEYTDYSIHQKQRVLDNGSTCLRTSIASSKHSTTTQYIQVNGYFSAGLTRLSNYCHYNSAV